MAKKKYIQLPKGYLSYSQWAMYKSSKDRYALKYFENRHDLNFDSNSLRYGKIF